MKHSIWMRLALIVLSVSMVLSLAACKPAGNEETTGKETEQKTEATTAVDTEATTEDDGEETTEVPVETTTEKTVETTEKKPVVTTEKKPAVTTEKKDEPVVEADPLNVFVKADALANATVNSGRIEKGVLSSDGKYVTFANKADGADGWMLGYTGGSVVSGQYLVIKYRFPVSNQTKATTIEIFCSTANAGPTGGDNVQLPVIADGEWHIGIVDMAKSKCAEKFPANSDGTYTIKYVRFDVLNGSHKVGDTVDVAYVGIDNSLADALALVKAEGMKSAYVNVGYTAYETYYASTGTTTPSVEDIVNVYVTPEKMVTASTNARFSGKELSADGSYITFTANGTGGDGYALLYSGGATVSGQYLVFKYRYRAENAHPQAYIEIFTSCTNGGPTGGDNLRVEVTADGEWHVAVADLSALNSKFVANDDGAYIAKYARFDIFDSGSTGDGDKVDIAYVGLTDNIDNVLKANKDVQKVYFKLGNAAAQKYTLYTSTGTADPAMTDVANLYFDAAAIAEKAPKGTNIGTVTLAEDGSYVTINGKGKSDGFFMVFSGNTEVTGQYIVMKYRYVAAEGATFKPSTRSLFSGNVYGGPTGDDTSNSFPVVADGEWHMTVFNLVGHLKDSVFVANEDGTYTVKYLRFDLADNLPEDCAFDIQYIALTDVDGLNNMIAVAKGEGLETVTARLDKELGTQTYYTATGTTEPPVEDDETETGEGGEVDSDVPAQDGEYTAPWYRFSLEEINGMRKEGVGGNAGVNGISNIGYATYGYETDSDGVLKVKGWLAVFGGVEKYQYSLDGGNTWIDIPSNQYTSVALDPNHRVYKALLETETVIIGSGFEKNLEFNFALDFKDMVNESLVVTIRAVGTSGDSIVFAQILNVFAHCTHVNNTAEWVTIDGDIQWETTTCSDCGAVVERHKIATTEGKLVFGADVIADKFSTYAQLMEDENGLDFARLTSPGAAADKMKGYLFASSATATNVGGFVGILYRTNTTGNKVQIYLDSNATAAQATTIWREKAYSTANQWHLALIDFTGSTSFDGEKLASFRFDWLDLANVEGNYVDFAFVGFFSDEDAAIAYYKEYVTAYLGVDDCQHYSVDGNWVWTGVEGEYKQKASCLLCGGYIVRDCVHAEKNIVPVTEKGDNGELYEKIVCACCQFAEQRTVYYKNSIEAFYAMHDTQGMIINPNSAGNKTAGVAGAPASSYLTFDATNKQIGKGGAYVDVYDVIKFSGWFAVNGGVDRYVYQINGGEWKTVGGNPGTPTSGGVYNAIVGDANIYDKTNSANKSHYQNAAIKIEGLQAYADQRIDIVFGAVPANNPGTDEEPNVLIITVIENLFVTCMHQGDGDYTATADPLVFNVVCNVCGADVGQVSGINQEGYKVMTPDVLVTMTPNGRLTHSVGVDAAANNMPYYHAVVAAAGDVRLTIAESARPMGDARIVSIVYRSNVSASTTNGGKQIQVFVNSASSNSTSVFKNTESDNKWHHLCFDVTAVSSTTGYSVPVIDFFNGGCAVGDVLDVAYISYFTTEEEANSFYLSFATNYGLTWSGRFDSGNCSLNGVTGTVTPNIIRSDEAIIIDASDFELNDASSLALGGWFVTPGGTAAYKYRVVEVDGVAVTTPVLVDWRTGGVSAGVTNIGVNRGWESSCGNGAAFQSPKAIDLTGFEGHTVTFEVVAVTKAGAEIVWARIDNIAVPAAE